MAWNRRTEKGKPGAGGPDGAAQTLQKIAREMFGNEALAAEQVFPNLDRDGTYVPYERFNIFHPGRSLDEAFALSAIGPLKAVDTVFVVRIGEKTTTAEVQVDGLDRYFDEQWRGAQDDMLVFDRAGTWIVGVNHSGGICWKKAINPALG
jgi:hypothetical protein